MIAPESSGIAIALALTKLREARELLAHPTVDSVESCQAQFTEVARVLEELAAAGAGESTPELYNGLREIRQTAQALQTQIRHGSRFCLGWLQTRLGVGYNQQGVPVMAESRVVFGEGRSCEM